MFEKIKKEYDFNILIMVIYKILNEKLNNINGYDTLDKEFIIHDPCIIKNDLQTQASIRAILLKIGQKYQKP